MNENIWIPLKNRNGNINNLVVGRWIKGDEWKNMNIKSCVLTDKGE